MIKVFLNKWFFLAALLIIGLSAFSFIAYKKTRALCTATRQCCSKNAGSARDILFWDVLSGQFSSISTP